MADYIFTAEGQPQGFRLGSYIYTLDGVAVGRVWAERAYRLDGSYVGAMFKNMVVDKPSVSKRSLPPLPYPGDAAPISGAESRRPVLLPYPDVFHLLGEGRERELEDTGFVEADNGGDFL